MQNEWQRPVPGLRARAGNDRRRVLNVNSSWGLRPGADDRNNFTGRKGMAAGTDIARGVDAGPCCRRGSGKVPAPLSPDAEGTPAGEIPR